jgi:hypothetical protein
LLSEEDPGDGGVEQHGEAPRARVAEEVGGSVPLAAVVEDGAADLGAHDVVEREAVVRGDAGLEERVAERGLPRGHVGAEHQRALHPAVGRVDQARVPPGGAHVLVAGTRVEPGVQAAPAAQHPGARVQHAVLRDEPLRGRRQRRVRQRVREVRLARHVAVGEPAALQEQHARVLRQRRRQRAPRRAAADHDVVVARHQRRVLRMPHEPQVLQSTCTQATTIHTLQVLQKSIEEKNTYGHGTAPLSDSAKRHREPRTVATTSATELASPGAISTELARTRIDARKVRLVYIPRVS